MFTWSNFVNEQRDYDCPQTSDNQMHKQLEACVVFILRKLPRLCHTGEAQTEKQFHFDKLRILRDTCHIDSSNAQYTELSVYTWDALSKQCDEQQKNVAFVGWLGARASVWHRCNGIQSLFSMTIANMFHAFVEFRIYILCRLFLLPHSPLPLSLSQFVVSYLSLCDSHQIMHDVGKTWSI